MKKIEEIYQGLNLIRMSIINTRQQINDQLDAIDMKIARLIPEEEGRGRQSYTLEEARAMLKDACTRQHGKPISSGSGRKRVPKA